MSETPPASLNCVAWAKRANGRWIVHGGLSKSAEAFMEHLERNDPDRLTHCCRNAYRLARHSGGDEDPKPWFYGGLFSLATSDEVKTYLARHSFTAALVPAAQQTPAPGGMGEATRKRMERIRQAIDHVLRESSDPGECR